MIKVISPVYKRPEISFEEFNRHWKEVHGPLAARIIPGLRKYVQNHLVKIPGVTYDIDGFVELWFDDLEAYKKYVAWRESSKAKEIADDAEKFIIPSKITRYTVEEHFIPIPRREGP